MRTTSPGTRARGVHPKPVQTGCPTVMRKRRSIGRRDASTCIGFARKMRSVRMPAIMHTPFSPDAWGASLLAGNVNDCDALIAAAPEPLAPDVLDQLRRVAIDLFVQYIEVGDIGLEPLLAVHPLLVYRDSATDPAPGVLESRRWRRIVVRLLLGRMRGDERWGALCAALRGEVGVADSLASACERV